MPFPFFRQVDAESKALLEKMTRAHFALKTYSARLSVEAASTGGGRRDEKATATIALARPGKARVVVQRDGQSTTAVSDGVWRTLKSPQADRKVKAERGEQAIRETLVSAAVFVAPVFYWMVTDPDASGKLLPGTVLRMGKGNDETLDGVVCDVVAAEIASSGGSARLTFAIGRDDRLLRRLTITAQRGAENLVLTERYTEVRANPALPADTFAPNRPAPKEKLP